ncbi:hypothetical protein AAFF_G00074030 [Aldrovandia affinis]|uniref:BAH domain-containing protein n=1 Tax=Aldrovandia affinis TaxID=143900 RepID=A0AAD7RYG7_9TELE|nr:hypothetical protein AAFF_G00074030 [Aldrovandia affinis]
MWNQTLEIYYAQPVIPLILGATMSYFTRLKMRRIYNWAGTPTALDRKLKILYYDALNVYVDRRSEASLIKTGQYILIEGEDDDNPYIAKLLKFFGDGTGKSKRAVVQWYVRFCEVAHNKRKLLGRKPLPQEIFLYQDRSCDNEINAETIIGTVQVIHLPLDADIPQTGNGTFYVKLCWDTKAFKAVGDEQFQEHVVASQPPARHPCLVLCPPPTWRY